MDDYKSEIRKISMAEFFPAIVHMKTDKWRLVQICATTIEGGYEMSYSLQGVRYGNAATGAKRG